MELIRGLHNLRPEHHGCVATIGNFDGVHLGHQAVLGRLADKAESMGLPTTVISFEPQPLEYFQHGEVPPRLTRLREKLQALRRFSVDRTLVLSFGEQLAQMTAYDFIHKLLIGKLGIKYLVVGDDFRFGRERYGDFTMLKQAGEEHGFEVTSMPSFRLCGERVSSTSIRRALLEGNLQRAQSMLGRPYRMSGRVAHGNKRGRTIGFPTANIFLHRKATPVDGVFAVELFGVPGEPVCGVANVGTRPTVDGSRSLLEVHLFDYDGDLYGRHVHVDFLQRLRPERRFDSFERLKQQILLDAEQARSFFQFRN